MTTAFLSYSWDDEPHVAWARALVARLKGDGITVTTDLGRKVPPAERSAEMESAVRSHEYVLVVCTPEYRARSEQGVGDGAYAGDIITAGALTSGNQRKFIPILRRGDWAHAGPLWLSEYYIDLRAGPRVEERYQELLGTVRGIRERMSYEVAAVEVQDGTAPVAAEVDPVRITGVITEEVGVPKLDGTTSGTYYRVSLRLSKRVAQEWESLFEENWNHSPRFADLRHASTAQVNQDRIVLSRTTLDEVLKDHRLGLVECVNMTNRTIHDKAEKVLQQEQTSKQARRVHKRHVQELAEQIRFDE